MKKNLVSVFVLIIIASNAVFASSGCETGFACTIQDLQKKEQEIKRHNTNKIPNKNENIRNHSKKKVKVQETKKYEDIFNFNKNL